MACFIVPTAEAVIMTMIKKNADKKNKEQNIFVQKMNRLNNMLWGGSALLAFEHFWHGEIVPWFPFLTNASAPDSAKEMLFEMGTSGVGMAVLATAAWALTVMIEKHLMEIPASENVFLERGQKR